MPTTDAQASAAESARLPLVSLNPLFVGLRYLLHKKLSYLAIVAVTLSVGTLIVVMSVFSGFQTQLISVIRGTLSDLQAEPRTGSLYSLHDWKSWREQVLQVENVAGAAPFVDGAGLMRLPGSGRMLHVFFRGVDPELEPTVSSLADYMQVGTLTDLQRTYVDPETGAQMRACFVGEQFFGPGGTPPDLSERPRELVLVTATPDLRRRLAEYAINGGFKTGDYEFDSSFVLLGLETAQQFVDSGGAVSGLNIKLYDYGQAPVTREAIAARMTPGVVLREFGPEARLVAAAADGSRLAATTAGDVVVYNAFTGKELRRVAPSGEPTALALNADGERLAVGLSDGSLMLQDIDDNEVTTMLRPGVSITALAFTSEAFELAVGYDDGLVELRDVETTELLRAFRGHEGPVRTVVFDADGGRLASVAGDGVARLWDVSAGRQTAVLRHETGSRIIAVAFQPGSGRLVVTGSEDGNLAVFLTETSRLLAEWQAHLSPVEAVGFGWTPDIIVSASMDSVAGWWTQSTDRSVVAGRVYEERPAGATIASAQFCRDGSRLACVGPDGSARLLYTGGGFNITTWEERRQTFLEAVAMEQFLQALIMSFILILAWFLIFAIVTTLVYEKRRDIGILKAIGFTRGQICMVFVTCGLAIGVLGALLGVGGGVLFADNINAVREFVRQVVGFDPFPPEIYYFDRIPAEVGLVPTLVMAGGAVLCSLVFSIWPALRAARMDAVESLHHE